MTREFIYFKILLNVYFKGEKDSITDSEKKQLKQIVEGLSKELRK